MQTIKWLTYLMFTMFAMTTDSVGVIIPVIIEEFHLTKTEAGGFHYVPMIAIGLSGVLLGFLADKLGRKSAIILGLTLFALNSFLFAAGNSYLFFLSLLAISGVAIGIFKTAALALIGDISSSTAEHTATMNTVEGFFGIGAIIGPALVARLLTSGISWKWLYLIAAFICLILIAIALFVRYPQSRAIQDEPASLEHTLGMLRDPFCLAFSCGAFLYVAVECAIYVWMPTLFQNYNGTALWLVTYAISIFFILRAAGRFLGAWLLARLDWTQALMLLSLAIFLCFAFSAWFGVGAAVYLLPLSGLFLSVIYPTLNSKGISCFPKAQHGAAAGVILFFTCAGAALGPLAMGALSDAFGGAQYGFYLATAFAALLFAGLTWNYLKKPAGLVLNDRGREDYASLSTPLAKHAASAKATEAS